MNAKYFTSRISVRATAAGVFSTLALMIMLLSLAGVFGLWKLDGRYFQDFGAGFWIWASLAWIASLYVASYVTAVSGRAITKRDGALDGFVVWSISTVLVFLFLSASAGGYFDWVPSMESSFLVFWGAFLTNFLAISTALWGGMNGSKAESKAELVELKDERAREFVSSYM